ncbi:MAG: GntR family transcriptional regulator [Syntrophaceae bacterium]|nr:GntR family transcriptional regulator [Syntrophaceae bacterium]
MRYRKFSPQRSLSLSGQFVGFLRNAILEGQFPAGVRLVENELQRKYGISRAPIREAFRILEKERLVVTIPRKGTFIRKVTKKDVDENFPLRAILEGLAARMAVPNLKQHDFNKLKVLLDRMIEAAEKNHVKCYHKYHTEFHNTFINRCNNETLVGILDDLRLQAIWFRFSYLKVLKSSRYVIDVHKKILDHFMKRDADATEALVKDHILTAYKTFRENIQ